VQNAACGGWVHHGNAGLVGLFGSLGRLLGLVGVDVSLLRLSQFGGDERDTGQASREGNESRDGEGAVKEDASRVAAAASRSVFVFFCSSFVQCGEVRPWPSRPPPRAWLPFAQCAGPSYPLFQPRPV